MASQNVVQPETAIACLRPGRSDQSIVGRLLRFWDSKNVKKHGEFIGITQNSSFQTLGLGNVSRPIRYRLMRFWPSLSLAGSESHRGITLVFVDEKGTMINGFVPAHESPSFRGLLEDNKVYEVAQSEVVKCPTHQKTTEHPYAIRFIKETIVRPVQANGPAIQLQQFMIRSYEQLNILANTNLELPDVVGWIKTVQGYVLHSPNVNAPILLQLLIAPPLEVELALLDNVAAEFKRLLTSRGSAYCIMLFTSIRPKKIGDALYLTSTKATRLYFGPTVAAITEFIKSLSSNQNQELPILDAGEKVLHGQVTPIGDLNMYLNSTQNKARIVDILSRNGWYTFSCSVCEKSLNYSAATHHCGQSIATQSAAVVRYRVEMLVDDGQNYATFVVADKDIIALTSKMATTPIFAEVAPLERNAIPRVLKHLRGRTYVFHVLTVDNFTTTKHPFNVVGITQLAVKETTVDATNKSNALEYEDLSRNSASPNRPHITLERRGVRVSEP